MKKIVLINPPWYFKRRLEVLSQNLGLAYIAAYLQNHGIKDIKIIDALAEGQNQWKVIDVKTERVRQFGLSYSQIVASIPQGVDFIGVGVPFTHNARIVEELSKVIKAKFPKVPIILGGVYPSTLPERALTEEVDYVVVGEGEVPILQLVQGRSPEHIPGLVYRDKGRLVNNGRAKEIENLDNIPFPARHLLPMEKYLNFYQRGSVSRRTVVMITSRGCPFDCNFCSIHPIQGYKWRARSPENVLHEIEQCIKEYNIEHIAFEEDNFTFDSVRAGSICEGIIELRKRLNYDLTWSVPNGLRIDTLNERLIQKMKRSGCSWVSLAVEHGDQGILNMMNKKLDLNKVQEVVKMFSKARICTNIFFMVAYPGETKEKFTKSIDFAKRLKRLGANQFSFAITRAYPGTKLYDYCRKKRILAEEFIEDALFLGSPVSIICDDFNKDEVLYRYKWANRRLNFSLKNIIRNVGVRIVPSIVIKFYRKTKWILSRKQREEVVGCE